MRVIALAVLTLVSSALMGAGSDARSLFQLAQKAEKSGDVFRAYILYSQAVTQDPYNPEYWRRRELMRLATSLRPPTAPVPAAEPAPVWTPPPAAEKRLALPPVELRAKPGRMDLVLRDDSRALFTRVAGEFGLEVVFDPEYQTGGQVAFRLDGADYREAIRALEAATGSFAIPIAQRRILVARDTPQKRADLEPVVSVEVPVPAAMSAQQAQELVRGVQQVLGLVRVAYDAPHSLVLVRDRLSRVRAAQELIEQLMQGPALVALEVEFLEAARISSASYGASLQTLFPLSNLGGIWNSAASAAAGFTRFLTFGGGQSLLGIGVATAQVFARTSQSSGHSLFRAEIRSVDGQQARLHVGDRYPIMTGRYQSSTASDQFAFPPSINMEELGLVLQLTPRVTGAGDVMLDLSVEFKALTGQVIDDLPVIANRKLESDVRLRDGEWAVIAGLMSASQARTISGLAGFSRVPVIGPLLRRNTQERAADELLVVLKPTILALPRVSAAAEPLGLGSEPRPRIPL
ncbi:MAG TPA: type II and III secretion system protein [Bryobacteraceae bacterium]|nr:type II and III secretion system protein [Bryobacteraceae bacterium]